jgi:subtilase family serine protease
MKKNLSQFAAGRRQQVLIAACASALLSACGGGSADVAGGSPQAAAQIASGDTTLQLTGVAPDVTAALPTFHVAPAELSAPDSMDAFDNAASARVGPHRQALEAGLVGMPTRGLTLDGIRAARALLATGRGAAPSTTTVTTYTPAQIRAAYALPALPPSGTTASATQAAQMGAGQTIYLIDAMSDPNVAQELAAFNAQFGLPTCTTTTISTTAALPLAAAPSSGCQFAVVYSTSSGARTATAPSYDSGWATEIALDVQWSHATAPLARIVLIEAPDSSINSLSAAIGLADSMGPGVVSMSFGGGEGSWTASVDPVFQKANMSYFASTGDSGSGVNWPAVSPEVVAVGGTSLTYNGSARSETVWSDGGGGISQYTAVPSYQTNAVPGMGNQTMRNVADVSFNANPYTGQYVAVISPGSSTASWLSAGGTSLASPQWAAIMAVADALRAQAGAAAIGQPHATLYGNISTVPGTYAADFYDVTSGSDGSCSTCSAKVGYDDASGLGTPNVSSLLSSLGAAAATPTAPVVTPATISGKVGTALSFTVSVTSPDAVTYALSGAPSGMSIASTGVVTWATPAAGSYAVTVTAKDTKTGLSGSGVYTVVIAAPSAPVVTSATVTGKVGAALSYAVAVTSPDAVTYSIAGQPSGVSISSAGVLSWASPVAGTYAVTVTAKDAKTGLSGQGVITLSIASASTGPVITATAMTGVAGKQLTGTIAIADPGVSALSVTISGVPLGMGFSASGLTLTAIWPSPVTGSYTLKVSVTDSLGRSTQASVPITITAH